jgi:hypothetical protein
MPKLKSFSTRPAICARDTCTASECCLRIR